MSAIKNSSSIVTLSSSKAGHEAPSDIGIHRVSMDAAPGQSNAEPETAAPARRKPASRPNRRGKTILLWGIIVIALMAGFVGYRYFLPADVLYQIAAPAPLVVDLTGPSTLDTLNQASVASRIQGRVAHIPVSLNDNVVAGQVLLTLDDSDLSSNLASAESALKAAQLSVSQARAQEQSAQIGVTGAQQIFDRQSSLFQSGNATQAFFESAQNALLSARSNLDSAKAATARAEAQQVGASAALQSASTQLKEATIRAPFAGTLIALEVNVGDVVSPGLTVLRLVDPSTIVFSARFDESAIRSVRPGQPASINMGNSSDRGIAGKVVRIGREVDADTREFIVDIKPDRLPENWAMGQRAKVNVETEMLSNVLSVPNGFIEWRKGQPGLWIADNGRARWHAVTLGKTNSEAAEVTSGLANSDAVLLPRGLYERMRVNIDEVRP